DRSLQDLRASDPGGVSGVSPHADPAPRRARRLVRARARRTRWIPRLRRRLPPRRERIGSPPPRPSGPRRLPPLPRYLRQQRPVLRGRRLSPGRYRPDGSRAGDSAVRAHPLRLVASLALPRIIGTLVRRSSVAAGPLVYYRTCWIS